MNTYIAPNVVALPVVDSVSASPSTASAVSWGAIFAGAAAAAAFSLILLVLGTGLGLSSVSPWVYDGISAKAFGVSTILWVTFTSIVASALGGYLAGRLRTRWLATHVDEVHFRDTAHGFLAWAVASLLTAGLLTSVIGGILNAGAQAGATVAGGIVAGAADGALSANSSQSNSNASADYFADYLFRADPSANTAAAVDSAAYAMAGASPDAMATVSSTEIARIFWNADGATTLPVEDVRYLASVVAQRRGISQQEAEERVNDTYARLQTKMRETEAAAKQAADKARKASSFAALWLFISLLIGAFVASLSATFGGRQRDA
jgi:hypothetical protein